MLRWLHIRPNSLVDSQGSPPASRWPLIVGVFVGIWLGLALYANTLSLPFFQDDVAHIRWLAALKSPLEPFLTATGIPAYRPFGEMLLKIWYLLLGHHDAAWLRFLNISLHTLNIALVAAVAWRLDRGRYRYTVGGLAAIFFAVLPFAYQAVPWINVFFYPLNNFLQLLMILFYWRARERDSKVLLVLAVFLGALSPFEIEYGLMNSGLLLALELLFWLQKRQRGIWLGGPLLVLLLNIGFLLVWLIVPKTAYEFGPPTLERMVQISFYLLQGLTYPTAPLASPLINQAGMNDLAAVALIGFPTILIVILVLAFRRKWSVLLFALSWFVLINLPALVTLTFDYVFNSPRLLYPVGPALAWLWSAFFISLVEFARRKQERAIIAGFATLATVIIIVVNVGFVRTRMAHYHIVEDTIHQLGEIARQAEPDEQLLVVNMPSWITPANQLFPLGNFGIQFIPFYVGIEDFVYAENDLDHPTEAIQFHNIRQSQPYYYGMHGQRVGWDDLRSALATAGDVYLTEYSPEKVTLNQVGFVISGQEGPDIQVNFDDRIALAVNDVAADGRDINLGLNWTLNASNPDDLTVFVHLYGPYGQLIDQADGYPMSGLSPFWLWDAGQSFYDRRVLSWPEDAPAGSYRVAVGMYDPVSGERLPAFDKKGTPLTDNAAIILELDGP